MYCNMFIQAHYQFLVDSVSMWSHFKMFNFKSQKAELVKNVDAIH